MSFYDEDEPRTPSDLIRDFAEMLRDRQWSGQYNTSCGCHPEYSSCCPECGVPESGSRTLLEWDRSSLKYRNVIVEGGSHTKGCRLQALLKEAEDLLATEDLARKAAEAEREREHSGKTGWDHLLEESPSS